MAVNKKWEIVHRGKGYKFELNKLKVSVDHRAELARVLREAVGDAGYAAKPEDRELVNHVLGLIGSGAEISNEAINELGTIYETTFAQEENEMAAGNNTDLGLMREIAAIAGSPEGRDALNLARLDKGRLSTAQRQIVDRHDMLLKQHNEIVDKERAGKGGGWLKGPRPYIPSDAMKWITNPHREQRRQLAAEWKARTLANPTHDYWHSDRGALNKSAKLAMKAAYEAAETGEITSVQVNPADGTVSINEE
jgi:hypothetical protein